MSSVDVFRSPQAGFSLTAQAEERLSTLIKTVISEIPAAVEGKVRELVRGIVAEVSAQYEQGLTKQVALLTVENEGLHQQNEELRKQLEACKAENEAGAPGGGARSM